VVDFVRYWFCANVMGKNLTWEEFEGVEMRVGTIVEVEEFPKARNPSWKLRIDFGDFGILKSSAQIVDLYGKDDLLERQVVAVINFPKKQIGSFMSECLVLGVIGDEKGVVLLSPEQKVKNGSRIA